MSYYETIAQQLKDQLMPHNKGKYAGVRMVDVPAKELLSMYYEGVFVGPYRMYVVAKMDRLKQEAEND